MLAYTITALLLLHGAAPPAISLDQFDDGFSHWQKKYGRDHTVERYSPHEFQGIANNLLEWQNPDGGWPKDVDWRVKRSKAEMNALMGVDGPRRSTFDNHNTYPQIAYLAEAFTRSGHEPYRDGALAGLNYVFDEQRASGGWRGADVDAITFNDGTMVGIMALLQDVARPSKKFAWVPEEIRTRAGSALNRAIECTLRCQIVSKGVKTAWGQQHDHETRQPVKARSYERPAISALESVGVVKFLMGLESPSPEVITAIESATTWFREAAIHGIRLKKIPIDPVRFENHTATEDTIVVEAPNAPPLWARYYDTKTGQPFFCNRDGIIVHSLAEVQLERRTGYAWYGNWPTRLLQEDYPRWKAKQDQ